MPAEQPAHSSGIRARAPQGAIAALALSFAAATFPCNQAAAQPQTDCREPPGVVRIGLTAETAERLKLGGAPPAASYACLAFAFGNEYQILDWLENGSLDAAVVSPFAAAVLLRPGDHTLQSLLRTTAALPFAPWRLEPYRVGLRILEDGVAREPSVQTFDALSAAIATGHVEVSVRTDGYLQPALPLLLTHAERRVAELAAVGGFDADAFWERFLAALRFGRGEPAPAGRKPSWMIEARSTRGSALEAGAFALDGGVPLTDVFVYNRRVSNALFPTPAQGVDLEFGDGTVTRWLTGRASANDTEVPRVRSFLDANYNVVAVGGLTMRFGASGSNTSCAGERRSLAGVWAPAVTAVPRFRTDAEDGGAAAAPRWA